ncbi:MAG: 1-acyl-sn-glycerol-3-phosphate acyltransferase [Fimbriimonadaceae bacterium]|nr:1-acyl-sn-glycerol-3-phosphate acyltransferase [Fimbriimonadaceae bacterium]
MRALKTSWYWFVRNLVRIGFFVFTGGFTVRYKERVPKKGAVIVAPNHVSYLDPPAVACAIPRMLSFMAKAELFKSKAFGWLISSLGSFPVKRGAGDREAIRLALQILEMEKAIIMFPEGTRGFGEYLGPFNKGVSLLARKTGAWVQPVGICGTFKRWPKGSKKMRFGRVKVLFGEPMRYADIPADSEKEREEKFLAELERRILELCHEGGYDVRSASSNPATKAPADLDASTEPTTPDAGAAPDRS